jgi:hypothetical protein
VNVLSMLLDRELLVSGAIHDLRGPLTALQGWAEIEPGEAAEAAGEACQRMREVLEELGRTAPGELDDIDLGEALGTSSCRAAVRGPPALLVAALEGLPGHLLTFEHTPTAVILWVGGLSLDAIVSGWSLRQVQTWIQEGGPGLGGARLRIAARLVGATRQTSRRSAESGEIALHFAPARS